MVKCRDLYDKFYATWSTWIHYMSNAALSLSSATPGQVP